MGRLLEKLKHGAPAYDVKVERDGFTLIGKPDHIDEFSDIVREAAEQAGEEFVSSPRAMAIKATAKCSSCRWTRLMLAERSHLENNGWGTRPCDRRSDRMRLPTSYNRLRAALAREQASKTFVVEHRQHYLRLAFQYDAIAALEAERPRLTVPARRPAGIVASLPN